MLIAIDFDGVLHDDKHVPPGRKLGPPKPGAKEAVVSLIEKGHLLAVFTRRGSAPRHVEEWLAYFDFPQMPVTNIKGAFDVIVDDRAITFTDWPRTLALIDGL